MLATTTDFIQASILEWRDRIDEAHRRLKAATSAVAPEEYDWRPDDGIRSIADQVWVAVESATWLAQCTGRYGAAVSESSSRPRSIDLTKAHMLLEEAHRGVLAWFEGLATTVRTPTIDTEEGPVSWSDLVHRHATVLTETRVGCTLLLDLIDPDRRR